MRAVNTSKSKLTGNMMINGKSVYINISTGEGFDEAFRLMEGTIHKLALKSWVVFESVEDAKQEVCLLMLEGMLHYDKSRGAALSTFLYQYAYNRIVDRIRSVNRRGTLYNLSPGYANDTVEAKIELEQRTNGWTNDWKELMCRLFVDEDLIKNVADDLQMSPWGLTRLVRRKLEAARNI